MQLAGRGRRLTQRWHDQPSHRKFLQGAPRPAADAGPLASIHTMYPLNTLTALPLFQLMCALEGRESGSLELAQTWLTFLAFCRLETTSQLDTPGFQIDVTRADLDTPVAEVRLFRQLTDDAGGLGSTTRIVSANFLFDAAPPELESTEIWARDFPDLATFQAGVEATREFQWAIRQGSLVNAFGYEDAEPLGDAG